MAPDDIVELFAAFGPVSVQRLFGGAGVYAEGTMFALVHDGIIYLKVDADTLPTFEQENLAPFSYTTSNGRRGVMSYRRMPERLYDDPDELAVWARAALAAARRGAARKRRSPAKPGSKRKSRWST